MYNIFRTLLTDSFLKFQILLTSCCVLVYHNSFSISLYFAFSLQLSLLFVSLKVIQRRYDGSVNFYRDWNDYKSGFGSMNSEFWLGMLQSGITRYSMETLSIGVLNYMKVIMSKNLDLTLFVSNLYICLKKRNQYYSRCM